MEQLTKNRRPAQSLSKGFSTIELMIAMAIMVLVLTAVVLASLGSQSFLIGSQTENEAMKIAQGLIEQEQALGRQDFNLVNSTRDDEADTAYCPTTLDGNPVKYRRYDPSDIYCYRVDVDTKAPDYTTKEVVVRVTWPDERGAWKNENQMTKLATLIANLDTPTGNDTCDSNLTGDWTNPQIESTISFASGASISDIDAYNGMLYVTADKTANATDPTLFVYDISDPANPTLVGTADNASSVTSGLNAVRAAFDPQSGKVFAFAASNSSSDYRTCDATADNACGEMDIFDVNNPHAITSKNIKLLVGSPNTLTGDSTSGHVQATSLYFRNGYVLLGLTATNGPEFNILDVHKPDTISSGLFSPGGTYEVGNQVNAMTMRGNYAYIASPNSSQELQILDLSNPSSPVDGSGGNKYGFSAGSGNGKSLDLVGNRLYFGRTTDGGAGEEFQILNDTTPASVLPELTGGGLDMGSSVNGIIVRNNLAFVLTNTALKILDIKDQNGDPYSVDASINLSTSGTLSFGSSSPTTEPSMDCEGNRIYISSNDNTPSKLYVIKPGS